MSSRDVPQPLHADAGLGRRRFLGGAAAGAALLGGVTAVPATAATRDTARSEDRPVRTESGLVTGVPSARDGVTVYKGIPYAASTAGENRWRPPRPAPSWKGVRAADTWGAACPQPVTGIDADKVPPLSEDCLNLNVWTSAASSSTSAVSRERRPVFVWIYGGRNSAMWASQPVYDGANLAAKGAVVVTFNHRVGAFGNLAHPELSAESGHAASGNWGVMDTVAALKWVRRNIAAFGGDPERVTIAGWSHGSSFVNILMISRLARGLYHRALLSSGVQYTKDPALGHVAGGYSTLAAAEANGTAFTTYMGASSLAGLRALSADEIVAKVYAPGAPSAGTSFGNVLDGYVLPTTYTGAMTSRTETDVPVYTGNNKDENGASPTLAMTVAQFQAYATTTFGDRAADFLALYPAATDAEAAAQYNAYARDEERVSTFLWGTQFRTTASNRSPVYNYFWSHTPPGTDTSNPIMPGQDAASAGAYHGADLYYLFGGLDGTDRPWTDQDHTIADTVSSYVVNFAATGNPNSPARHSDPLPAWPALRTGRPLSMEIGDGFAPVPAADSDAKYAFLKTYLESQTTEY
ncbi:carboxylesterase/lipase family protein [Streptomyces cylindrosporus]|uniref:Carboxylesterase family protein n=1 Tax=Streptomyces cylindrosporus TaxID=2927583 RepID=A0ABS9YQL9_9ACTN|nr:carboxylesterase family protein [Streptomyces cylindrosporus]MCI3278890.1 carboxylesterase family protein [Streptomyces cylindrosporus]